MAVDLDDLGIVHIVTESLLYSLHVSLEAIRADLYPILNAFCDIGYKGIRGGGITLPDTKSRNELSFRVEGTERPYATNNGIIRELDVAVFLPTNPQISSISKRLQDKSRILSSIKAVQPWPTLTPSRMIVSR